MIQVNELIVGNWVNVPRLDQSPFRIDIIEHLSKDHNKVGVNQPVIGGFPTHPLTWYLEDLQPIPLTEEILLKRGAKLHGIEYIIKASALPIKIRISYGIAYCEFGNVYLGDRIKFLHELQNIYHALTGQELKIEL